MLTAAGVLGIAWPARESWRVACGGSGGGGGGGERQLPAGDLAVYLRSLSHFEATRLAAGSSNAGCARDGGQSQATRVASPFCVLNQQPELSQRDQRTIGAEKRCRGDGTSRRQLGAAMPLGGGFRHFQPKAAWPNCSDP